MEFQERQSFDRSPINEISKIDPNTPDYMPDSTLSMKASISKNSPETFSNDTHQEQRDCRRRGCPRRAGQLDYRVPCFGCQRQQRCASHGASVEFDAGRSACCLVQRPCGPHRLPRPLRWQLACVSDPSAASCVLQ